MELMKELSDLAYKMFPSGNYRYYIAYFSFIFVATAFLQVFPTIVSIIVHGPAVSTDSFYAVVTTQNSNLFDNNPLLLTLMRLLLNAADICVLALFMHTCVSLIADASTVGYNIGKRLQEVMYK
jgi:hypothetical protein